MAVIQVSCLPVCFLFAGESTGCVGGAGKKRSDVFVTSLQRLGRPSEDSENLDNDQREEKKKEKAFYYAYNQNEKRAAQTWPSPTVPQAATTLESAQQLRTNSEGWTSDPQSPTQSAEGNFHFMSYIFMPLFQKESFLQSL